MHLSVIIPPFGIFASDREDFDIVIFGQIAKFGVSIFYLIMIEYDTNMYSSFGRIFEMFGYGFVGEAIDSYIYAAFCLVDPTK